MNRAVSSHIQPGVKENMAYFSQMERRQMGETPGLSTSRSPPRQTTGPEPSVCLVYKSFYYRLSGLLSQYMIPCKHYKLYILPHVFIILWFSACFFQYTRSVTVGTNYQPTFKDIVEKAVSRKYMLLVYSQFIINWKCRVVFAITRVTYFHYRQKRMVSFSCQLLGKLKKPNKCTATEKFRYIWTEMLYLCMKIWTGYQFLYKILLWRPSLNNVLVIFKMYHIAFLHVLH